MTVLLRVAASDGYHFIHYVSEGFFLSYVLLLLLLTGVLGYFGSSGSRGSLGRLLQDIQYQRAHWVDLLFYGNI